MEGHGRGLPNIRLTFLVINVMGGLGGVVG